MEGEKQEDWWFGEFPNYSLQKYKDMPIYQRFKSSVRPFNKIMGEYREAFWRDDNCFIFEWFDSSEQKGEKFGLDHNSITYFYEHWYTDDENIHTVEKSWLCEPTEWGVIIKYFPEYEEEITWNMEKELKVMEKRTKTQDGLKSKKTGQKMTPDGIEDFTEVFWQTPNGYEKERIWIRGDDKGQEKEVKDGDKIWGQSEEVVDDEVMKKTWNQDGNHKWGESLGEEGYEKWHEKWDKNSEGSYEEVIVQDRMQNRGKLRIRASSHNYRVEWEGVKPEIRVPESGVPEFENLDAGKKTSEPEASDEKPAQKSKMMKKPESKKLRSGRGPAPNPSLTQGDPTSEATPVPAASFPNPSHFPNPNLNLNPKPKLPLEDAESLSDPSMQVDPFTPRRLLAEQVTDQEKLSAQLSNLFKDLKTDLNRRISDLKSSDTSKTLTAELSSLQEDSRNLRDPNPFDPQDSLSCIRGLRDLDRRLLSIENNLLASQPSPDQLKSLFDQSSASVLSLVPTLDPSGLTCTPGDLQKLSKDFDQASSGKDKVRIIASITPKLQDLRRASQRDIEDDDKELASISFQVNPVLKALERAIKESQETLERIRKEVAKDGQNFEPFIQGFANRAKDWLQALDSAPYTETLPQVTALLVDMENLKKEMIGSDLAGKLADVEAQVKSINNELLKTLASSGKPDSGPSAANPNLNDLAKSIAEQVDLAKALVDKALGKDRKTGNAEIDAIAPLAQDKINVEPFDMLKGIWIQGKKALDNVNKALASLAESTCEPDEKVKIGEIIEHNEISVSGKTPESKTEAFEQLEVTLDEFLPSLLNSSELLKSLAEKVKELMKKNDDGDLKDLWRALMISEKICEKLMMDKTEVDEGKSPLDGLPDDPKAEDLQKALVRSQELNLDLINNDKDITASELADIGSLANKRPKKAGLSKDSKSLLRSASLKAPKGLRGLRGQKGSIGKNLAEPFMDLIDQSLRTSSELVLWISGSKASVSRQLEALSQEKDSLRDQVLSHFEEEETLEKVLNYLKHLEDTKQQAYHSPEISKTLSFIVQKSEKVLDTTAKIIESPLPSEVEEVKKRKMAENLPEYFKRIGFYLSIFFKMVKEATGVDEGGDNFEDALSQMKKKQAVSMLPFEAEELMNYLLGKSQKDLKKMKFLAGLVGTDEDIEESSHLEEQAEELLPEHKTQPTAQESLAQIDLFLHGYREVANQVEGKINELLQKLVQKLVNPEPLEKDVACLIETMERLAKVVEKMRRGPCAERIEELERKKDSLPGNSKELVPYLCELNRDYSVEIVALLPEDDQLSKPEEAKLQMTIKKKLKAAPVQVLREIEHLFSGPDTEDMVSIILKLNRVTNFFLKHHSVGDPALYSMCTKDFARLAALSPMEVKALGKDFADVLLSFIDSEDSSEYLDEESSIRIKRQSLRGKPVLDWESVFRGKGLDLDSGLLTEIIHEEQQLASVYLINVPAALGSAELKKFAHNLLDQSREIRNDLDIKSKIENYFQLRLEESKLVAGLSGKLESLLERISELDQEKEANLARGLAEVSILVDQNNPLLKEQVQLLSSKEAEYKSKTPVSIQEFLMRLASRMGLEKELLRIKEEAKPKSNENSELMRALSEIETKLYSGLKSMNSFLQVFSADLLPGTKSLKHLTDQPISNSLTALIASIDSALSGHKVLLDSITSVLESSPARAALVELIHLVNSEFRKDDSDTEVVFTGLFKLCGSAEDKALSKKLREARASVPEEKQSLHELSQTLLESLGKVLPARAGQSKLQSKLIRETAKLRDGIDEIDLNDEDLVTKALREANNAILPEDFKAKELLDKIKKALEAISENSPSNIPECIERIEARMKEAEKIERLRKELREKSSKEINRLKGDIQDRINEISTIKASLDAQKTNFDAQIVLLQNTANLNASLVDKLTAEAVDKEKNLSAAKNCLADMKVKQEELEDELNRNSGELDSVNQELRALRKANKEKDSQIRDLTNSLESSERATDKFSLGDKEKSEVLDKIRDELRQNRAELEDKIKNLEEVSDSLSAKERQLKKVEIEKSGIENELEKLKNEKNLLKGELIKANTEKSELEEKMKMNENSEEIRKIEKILEEKQKELEEAEEKLTVAKRYQMLYPELTVEKQEIENKLREVQIDFQEIRRKHDDLKSENDQLKYKMNYLENSAKSAEELLRENQKLKIRVNFLEQSGEGKDSNEQLRKLADELAQKEAKIRDLLLEIERLKKVIEDHIKKFKLSLTRNFLIRLCHTYKEMERQGFSKWRGYKKEQQVPKLNLIPCSSLPEESKDESSQIADQILNKTASDLFSSNKIILQYNQISSSTEKPLSFINVFKFLEELMDKKFESDKQEVSESKPVTSMPEFMMEFLIKTYGIQSLALKFLSQFIGGFYDIYKEGNKYAAFFARILQIFHPEPAPLSLAVFIVKARMDFHPLIDTYERSVLQSERKNDAGRNAFDNAGCGGKAFLGDTIELIYALFQDDPAGGEMALELIKPEKVSVEDYVAYKICHKMAKIGKTPEMIFNLLDKDAGGTVDCKEFISGTKGDLDLWISDGNVQKLMEALDANQSKEISKESFMSKINMKFLLDCNKNPSWTVSKCSFLSALLDVFSSKQRKLLRVLHEKSKPSGTFNKQQFASSLLDLDPNLDGQTIDKMYDEAKDKGAEVNLQVASEVASKYSLGDLRSFKSKELLQELQRRKIMNSTEDETVSVSTKSKRISFIEGNVRIDRDEEEKTIIRKKLIKKLVKRIVG